MRLGRIRERIRVLAQTPVKENQEPAIMDFEPNIVNHVSMEMLSDVAGFLNSVANKEVRVEPQALEDAIQMLLQHWNGTSIGSAYEKMGLSEPYADITHDQIMQASENLVKPIFNLMFLFQEHDMWGYGSEDDRRKRELGVAFNLVAFATDVVEREYYATRLADPAVRDSVQICKYISTYRCSSMHDPEQISGYQQLLIWLLQILSKRGFRRMGEECYKQILFQNIGTHAWEHVMSIEEFVYEAIDKDRNSIQWQNATATGGTIDNCIKYLCRCDEHEFPKLRPDRSLFSFNNGVYDASLNSFHPHLGPLSLDNSRVAMSYFNQDFDESAVTIEDWRDIDTSLFGSVFEYQGYDPGTLDWVYALLGRLIFPVNMLDSWQVAPFFKGVAGCGKSTVSALIKYLFPARLVSTISANSESKFGLAGLCDTFVCICTEVTKKFPLDRGVWQSMVTGERLNVPRKHKTPLDIDWIVPILMSGNENPQWTDKSRSVHRRLVQFLMMKRVMDSNPHLLDDLKSNISLFLVKIVRAYLDMVHHYGHVDIWKEGVMSQQIHDWHAKLLESVDPLSAFMADHKVLKSPEKYCKLETFAKAYNTWRKEEKFLPNTEFTEEEYQSVFSEHDLQVVMCRKPWGNPSTEVYAQFLIGCEIRCDPSHPGAAEMDMAMDGSDNSVETIIAGIDGFGTDEPI